MISLYSEPRVDSQTCLKRYMLFVYDQKKVMGSQKEYLGLNSG